MENLVRYRVRATGRDQGVGFRYFAYMEATHLGVTGYAYNQYDGSVELELQGRTSTVAALLMKIRKGNGFMRVDDLEIQEIPVEPEEKGFKMN